MSERRCRYTDVDNRACTAAAVDPLGEILLCSKHLAAAYEMLRDRLKAAYADALKG